MAVLLGPSRVRASSPVPTPLEPVLPAGRVGSSQSKAVGKGQNQLSNVPAFSWPLVAKMATDINTNPSYSRTTVPDLAFGLRSGPDITIALDGNAAHSIGMVLVAAWPSNTNVALGGSSDPRHPHGFC